MAETVRIDEKTWRIEDSGVRFFLLEGEREALLIDSGMNTPDARAIAGKMTALPLRLLNTHADPDHISGNAAFAEFLMSPQERENYHDHHGSGTPIPIGEGDEIDLGGRRLTVIDLPGHTPGSVALLEDSGVLYGGDAIQDGRIFMFGARRNMAEYIRSLGALWEKYGSRIRTVYPSHGSFPLPPTQIPCLIEAARAVADGAAKGKKVDFMGREIAAYPMGCATFLCDR